MTNRTMIAPITAMTMLSTLTPVTSPLWKTSLASQPPTTAPTMPRMIVPRIPSSAADDEVGQEPGDCSENDPADDFDVRLLQLERGQAVRAQDQRDLGAVLELVLDKMPHDPGAGHALSRSPLKLDPELGRSPPPKAVHDDLPGLPKRVDDLGCRPGRLRRPPSRHP